MTRTDPPNPNDSPPKPAGRELSGPARLVLTDHLAATAAAAGLAQCAAQGIEPLTPGLGDLLDKIADRVAAARRIYHGTEPATALPDPTTVEINGMVALWRKLPPSMSQHGIVTALATMLIAERNGSSALAELAPQADPMPARLAALAATEETTGPDGDECSPGCTCRAGWTEPGQ